MNSRFDQAIDMALGAGLMYLFDPDQGQERREQLRDRAQEQLTRATGAATEAGRRARERGADMVPAAKLALFEKLAMDQKLLDRVRATLGDQKLLEQVQETPAAQGILEQARATLDAHDLLPSSTGAWQITRILALLTAAALGAGLMFILDPQMGRRRRAMLRDQLFHARRQANETLAGAQAEAANRMRGLQAEARRSNGDEPVSDRVLAERVRGHLNGVTSHPGSITVAAHQGHITLTGPILADEVEGLLARVRSVPGVKSVEDRLEVHREPGNIPGLQGRAR